MSERGADKQSWWSRHLYGPDPPHVFVPTDKSAATEPVVAHVLARPDSIRHRAQSAAGISTAVAAALAVAVIGQVLGENDEDWGTETIAAILAAFGLWLLTVWLYVRVVTLGQRQEEQQREDDEQRKTPRQRKEEVADLIRVYETYSSGLRKSLKVAALGSTLALAATGVAVVSVVAERLTDELEERDMVLNERGAAAVSRLCGSPAPARGDTRVFEVEVAANDLSKQIVEVRVLECDGATRTVRLPRAAILATRNG